MVTPAAKREAVAHLRAVFGMGERQACRVIGAGRTSMRYRSRRDDDGSLREKLRRLAYQRRRFGYRRLHVLLRREGIRINRKKTQRLYRDEGLAVRRSRSPQTHSTQIVAHYPNRHDRAPPRDRGNES